MSTPAGGKVMSGAPERKQIAKKIGEMTFGGRVFVNVVSLKYIGMKYLNVG